MTGDAVRSRPRFCGPRRGTVHVIGLLVLLGAALPGRSWATVSLGAWLAHSPDDINNTNIPGLQTFSGDDATVNATLPFSVTIEGTSYGSVTISTNGWLEFGGNTQGTSDPTNACLPTSKHTNPFLAAYWNDLDTFGTNIRYGTVGTSPNRTFLVDYEVDVDPTVDNGGADDIRFQVQVHERSNIINVRYRESGNLANGQGTTIGFQGAARGRPGRSPATGRCSTTTAPTRAGRSTSAAPGSYPSSRSWRTAPTTSAGSRRSAATTPSRVSRCPSPSPSRGRATAR